MQQGGSSRARVSVSSLPPAHPRPLLRKSSSASLLDTGSGDVSDGNKSRAPKNGAKLPLPKTQRGSESLQLIDTVGSGETPSPAPSATKNPRRSKTAKEVPYLKEPPSKAGITTPKSTRTTTLPALHPAEVKAEPHKQPARPPMLQQRDRSKRRKRPGDILLTRPATIDVVVKYQLGQHELKKFKTCFSQIDLDSSGLIDYDEFFEFIDETKTPFSEGLFRMIDSDNNGTIDYEEFVHAMVLYCMYTRDEILHFAFDTFDPAMTGSIGEKEFKRLISIVNDGKPVFPGNFKNALTEFDRNKDGALDFEEFKVMNKRYPMLLFPCFRLQDRMQKSTLGENHWLQLHKRLYQRLKIENYQKKHNGALPALNFVGSVKKFFGLDQVDVYEV